MPLLGQASGGFTESSSALRILHVGIRNTVGILTDDAFTQTNPPQTATGVATISQSIGLDTAVLGVLSGSIAFARPDAGSNYIGGPSDGATNAAFQAPLGLFINNAVGNAFENTPGIASGKGPYVSGQGTYASSLYETRILVATGGLSAGDDITFVVGQELMASLNGYLMPRFDGATGVQLDNTNNSFESKNSAKQGTTTIGILKMPADSVQQEIVFDQRI